MNFWLKFDLSDVHDCSFSKKSNRLFIFNFGEGPVNTRLHVSLEDLILIK